MSCCKSVPDFKFSLVEGCDDTFLPTKGEPKATGWDVRARTKTVIQPYSYFKIPLGFKAFPPDGWWFHLYPRSSTFIKLNMHCLTGIIDEAFPLEVMLCGQYIPEKNNKAIITINAGDRIGQIVPVKRQEMIISNISSEEFDKLVSERASERVGGMGSTGK
jgi:dUTPase